MRLGYMCSVSMDFVDRKFKSMYKNDVETI